jgi:hypothetical protein
VDEPAWRLKVTFASQLDAQTLLGHLEAANDIDTDAVSLETNGCEVLVYASTRVVVEAAKATAWESIRSMQLKPTLMRIDEWLPGDSCWTGEPPSPASCTGGVGSGLLEGLFNSLGDWRW